MALTSTRGMPLRFADYCVATDRGSCEHSLKGLRWFGGGVTQGFYLGSDQNFFRCLVLILTLLSSVSGLTQQIDGSDAEDVGVSYIYAATMGSGTYKIKDRRISMLSVPFSFTQQQLTQDRAGMKWYVPVVIGYDDVVVNESRGVIEDNLVTLTVLPGFEYQWRYNENWVIKPFGHLGATRDFTLGETILMSVLGVRVLGTWHYDNDAEVRWGAALRLAGEYQLESNRHNEFSLWETGLDYRRNAGIKFLDREVNVGIYYQLQYFLPDWEEIKPILRDPACTCSASSFSAIKSQSSGIKRTIWSR
jgi:hypothetical protein